MSRHNERYDLLVYYIAGVEYEAIVTQNSKCTEL